MEKILTIKNLDINFRTRSEIVHAIRNISLDIYGGEILAIVGESGSGKSVLTKSFTNMLGDTGYIINGEIVCHSDVLKEPVDMVKIHREAIDRKYLKEFVLINKKRIKKNNKEIKKITNSTIEDIQLEIASLSNEIKQ
jgi:oligopeptide transport system ATP-binding protein